MKTNYVLLTGLLIFGITHVVFGQETIMLATYGLDAESKEGDADYTQVIFFQVPSDLTDSLYVRLFDPDIGGTHDAVYAGPNTESRFSLYGGAGAFTTPSVQEANPNASSLEAGTLIRQATFGNTPATNNQWYVFARLTPSSGETVNGLSTFKLVVQGLQGNDANLYDLQISLDPNQNMEPEGLRLFTFSPTVRLDRRDHAAEMRFDIPAGAQTLTAYNFDAARATLTVETAFRTIPVSSSGQDEWQSTRINVLEVEAERQAALTFTGNGQETPNDATFYVNGPGGNALPIQLPIQLYRPQTRPIARLNIEPLADCYGVAFDASQSSDPGGDLLDFSWQFGDGGTGTGKSPVHRYEDPGTYDGYLMVTNASNRTGNGAAQPFSVLVKRSPTAAAGSDQIVAPGQSVAFNGSAATDSDHQIVQYRWDFNDGAQATGRAVTHSFQQPGRYLVTLRAEDNANHPCNFATDQLEVIVNAAPVAEAGETFVTSIGESFTLNGGRSYDTDGTIASYLWNLGDGSTGEGTTIEHAYTEAGTYQVVLTVTDDAGAANSTDTDAITIHVNAPPVAVAGDDRTAALGEVVTFDGSTSSDPDGTLIDHRWTFGDGQEGSDVQVSYAYHTPGRYEVTLTVRDNSGSRSSIGRDSLVVLVNAAPVADAGADQRVSTSEVQFSASASSDADGQITSYLWEFGDGTSSSEANPLHAYRSAGTYRVRLTVTDDSGTIRNSHEDEIIVVVNAMPVADAGADQTAIPGQSLQFDGAHSFDPDGNVARYFWDFGDGTTATGVQSMHAYAEPGTYTVRLRVEDNTGDPLALDYDEARVVVNASPIAKAGPDVRVAPGDVVTFDGRQSFDPDGSISAYRWDFSDGTSAVSGSTSARTYAQPGVYTARLTVTDDSGVSNATAEDELSIYINQVPTSVAGADQHVCEAVVSFDGSASSDADRDPLSYRWDFGDGSDPDFGVRVRHTYREGGTYPVILTVDDGSGLSNATDVSDMVIRINRPPVAEAGTDQQVCAGDVVLFDGSDSQDPEGGLLKYTWNLGEGTTLSGINPTFTYKQGGVYPVRLTVNDDSGLSCNADMDQMVVHVAESPIAFAGPDIQTCTNTIVQFDGSESVDSDGVVNRFIWDFGDGSSGGGSSPVHTYTEAGTYRVSLTIEGDIREACDYTDTDDLTVVVTEGPVARLSAVTSAALGTEIAFDASQSTGAEAQIVSWSWDFGDGSSARGETATHAYDTPGVYTITLTIQTNAQSNSCQAVATRQVITINAPPVADGGEDRRIAPLEEVVFNGAASRDRDGAVTQYSWDFGDGQSAQGIEVKHRFQEPGTYPVLLTVSDNAGLSNSTHTDTIQVIVNAPPRPIISMPPQACINEAVAFNGSQSTDADGPISSYTWHFGDGETMQGESVTHAFDVHGRYAISLMTEDETGVQNSRTESSETLIINRPPQAQAGPDQIVCPNTPVSFDGSQSLDWDGSLTAYSWDFGDGRSASGSTVMHSFAEPGSFDVTLTVSDDSGTSCQSQEDVVHVRVNAAPVADAGPDREVFVGGAHDAVLFDASPSSDPDNSPLTYAWDFGDGTQTTGQSVFHAFSAPGTYTVQLSVSDHSGLTCGVSVDEAIITVRSRTE